LALDPVYIIFPTRRSSDLVGVELGIEKEIVQHLIHTYGSNIDVVFDLYETNKAEAMEKNMDPVVLAMLQYAIRYELAYKPIDFFIQRTGGLFFDITWVNTHKVSVISYMAHMLKWSKEQEEAYKTELNEFIQEASFE